MWIHRKNNYNGGALHPSPNYWGCLSTSSPHPPMPMLSPPSPPLLCTLHFHTSLLLSTPLPSFTALPRPLLISSFTSLYLCTSLLLPSHSCHLLPTSPLLSFTRRSSACWMEYRSWNSWLDNIFCTNSIRCWCPHGYKHNTVVMMTSRLWITYTSDNKYIQWMNRYYSIMYTHTSFEFNARIQLLHHQICII